MTPPQPQEEEPDYELLSVLKMVYYAGVQSTVKGARIKTPTMSVDAAADTLLAWRNTYAKAYAKTVGLRAIGEDVAETWYNKELVKSDAKYAERFWKKEAPIRFNNKLKAEQRDRLLSTLEEE